MTDDFDAFIMKSLRASYQEDYPGETVSDEFLQARMMIGMRNMGDDWPSIVRSLLNSINNDKLLSRDPASMAAARIVQAVVVALAKGDVSTLQDWEKTTLKFMRKHPADYVSSSLPAIKYRGRPIVTSEAVRRLKNSLELLSKMSASEAGRIISMTISSCMPELQATADVSEAIAAKYEKRKNEGRAGKVDPEVLLIDALESFGIARSEVHAWLKPIKL